MEAISERINQTVRYEITKDNYAVYPNQTITEITTDEEGYAWGMWHGKRVITWSLNHDDWYTF